MKVYFNIKQAGKWKNHITRQELILNSTPNTLRELLTELVINEVENFNTKNKEKKLISYLTNEDIEDCIKTGKVSFGDRYNLNDADPRKAVETALLAYEDGVFRVFLGDREAGMLDDSLELNEGDVLTFIKLTMLSGRMW